MGQKREQWLKISNRLLSGTLVLLGFTSCDPSRMADEYGTPYSDYEIKGRITNQEGTELAGMRVITKTLIQSRPDDAYLNDTVMTDAKGEFARHLEGTNEGRFRVVCEDPSGVYEADSTEVKMEPKGGEGWYVGHDSKEVNIELKKKNA